MLQYPAAASTPNTKGKIPLHYAAREGRSDMVAYFLYATPYTAKIASKKKKLALHFAAGDGHTDVVQQLLRVYPEGASLPSAKGKLALHFAARWGHMQIASDLLFLHPEGVRCVDWDGSLPLHDAAREGQVVMSKFLIERYPIGLSIANIRGEIPLFPAVRSGNVNLVILYLQGWAMGGMHILKAVSADDNIHDWDWNIVELCLRGAVENFSDCPLLEGKEPPAVCCTVARGDSLSGLDATASSLSASWVLDVRCQPRQEAELSSFGLKSATTIASNAAAGLCWSRLLVVILLIVFLEQLPPRNPPPDQSLPFWNLMLAGVRNVLPAVAAMTESVREVELGMKLRNPVGPLRNNSATLLLFTQPWRVERPRM